MRKVMTVEVRGPDPFTLFKEGKLLLEHQPPITLTHLFISTEEMGELSVALPRDTRIKVLSHEDP